MLNGSEDFVECFEHFAGSRRGLPRRDRVKAGNEADIPSQHEKRIRLLTSAATLWNCLRAGNFWLALGCTMSLLRLFYAGVLGWAAVGACFAQSTLPSPVSSDDAAK